MSNHDLPTQPQPTQVPVIELGNVTLNIGRAPADETKRAFFIGPVVLQLSLDDDAVRVIVKALTGVEIAKPGELL